MAGFTFGSSFQAPTAATTQSFGAFGAPAATQPAASTFSFGAPAKTTGFSFAGFGAPSTSTTAPTFGTTGTTGFSFGSTAPATTAGTGFGFGFGQPASTAAAGTGFSFGQPAAATTATTGAPGFAFGQPAGTGFGFGAQTTSTAPTFNFSGGLGTASSAPGFSFGTAAPITSTGSTGFNFGGFGAGTSTTQSSLFGGGSLFSTGFGTSAGAAPTFGAAGAAAQAGGAGAAGNVANLAAALSLPTVFNDERDAILAKWNQLQAFWGTGKGYFSGQAPPVTFTPDNPFCCFKAIGYSALPTSKPEDGLVALVFEKRLEDVQPVQTQLVEGLHRVLGSKPTLSVCVDGLKSLSPDKCELVVYVMERSPSGAVRRVPSNELATFMDGFSVKPQLTTLGVQAVVSKAAPSKDWLKQYLDNPPCGMDPLLWQQAKLDNPDPDRLIPVPMIGFAELRRRFKLQEHEIKQHQSRLDIIAEDIAELQRQHATTVAKIEEHKRKQSDLNHRVLKVMVHQEVNRKLGFGIQPEEEKLRTILESNLAELSAPTQFKGRLNELMSQIKMQNNHMTCASAPLSCTLDPAFVDQLKEHLKNQQCGISQLVKILKTDMEDLKAVESSLHQGAAAQRR
uniref:Putative nucleoporin p54 strongylocentrotus purpuratus n=2 Tax=Ixodes ricinus TaxID=34613 RepID=V5IDF5_IXORI